MEEVEEVEECEVHTDGKGSLGGSDVDIKSPKSSGSGVMDPSGPEDDPEYRFTGMMRDGKKNGHGRLVFRFGVYEGNWANDMMDGHGKMTLKSGNVYEGEFSRNRFEGKGVLRWRNGKVYTGSMRGGNMSGKGILASKDGDYEGDFYHNEFFGKGKMEYHNGDTYEGEWKQDMMWGQGCLRTSDGVQYEGTFYKNQKHGRIIRTDLKNKLYSERYEYDLLKTSYKIKKQSKASSAVEKFLSKVISSPASPPLTSQLSSSSGDGLFDRPGASKEDVARHLDRRARSNRALAETPDPRDTRRDRGERERERDRECNRVSSFTSDDRVESVHSMGMGAPSSTERSSPKNLHPKDSSESVCDRVFCSKKKRCILVDLVVPVCSIFVMPFLAFCLVVMEYFNFKFCVFSFVSFQLTFLHPPVRATVGEVRYSIEIDVGGGSKGSILQNQILRKILAENGLHV